MVIWLSSFKKKGGRQLVIFVYTKERKKRGKFIIILQALYLYIKCTVEIAFILRHCSSFNGKSF
ncbi:hypothetical protein BCR42DRAFT_424902 [Absidia repens]|uniref:Uncharacterized protein n=1 Tax=Absidia repens TaxID=90262 RepID=A0A1X2I312_9FUNG|nr:hypothetical protein BCR42DRAFT_424902 [Absidia repens]